MLTFRQRALSCALLPALLLFQPKDVAAEIDWPQLKFTQVASGVSVPTSIADAGDSTGRLFVTEQSGRVLLVQSNGVVPFLDLQDRVQYLPFSEVGLLSVAFSPGFLTNRHFYVFYNSEPFGASTISRFSVSSTNAELGDPATEQPVLTIEPSADALYTLSGGLLLFGPDGFLYVGMGDSGFGPDSPNQAQNMRSFRGKILRIDVESPANRYQVPIDNPFVADTNSLPEIWALGVRNPWRFSFDRATGDFYMGDVGQIESEEVNFKAAATPGGQNYGWPIREGRHLYAGLDIGTASLSDPILEYLHTGPPGSVTGGFVYRGAGPTRMTGLYFYADAYSGKIWGLKHDGINWVNQEVAHTPYFITAFGEDQAGQLYLSDYITGTIFRIEDDGQAAAPAFNPPGTNSFAEIITISSISTNALIRYTTNGLDPQATDPSVGSGEAVTIDSGTTLKARTFRDGLFPSPVTSVTYNLKVSRPTFSPPLGTVTNGQPISIHCATPGATILYSLDDTDPTGGAQVYSTPITYDGSVTLRARAFKAGFADSGVALFSPSALRIQNFVSSGDGIFNSFDCASLVGWNYQPQVAEVPTQWRDLGAAEAGTGGTLTFNQNNVYPAPARRLFRVKVVEDLGL